MWYDNNEYKCMVYLMWCVIHNIVPEADVMMNVDGHSLLKLCKDHKVVAFVSPAVMKAGDDVISPELKEEFSKEELKAVRVNILFEAEKEKVVGELEKNKIPYMLLKGCIIKNCYSEPTHRQMGDIDIWFKREYAEKVKDIMLSMGYTCEMFEINHHDEYLKKPFYVFEMHRHLFKEENQEWVEYYKDIEKKLIPVDGKECEYQFSDEDFYIYFYLHAYKHLLHEGTGIRTLLDFYLYLHRVDLDFSYVEQELRKINADECEAVLRGLSVRIFDSEALPHDVRLEDREEELLETMLESGAYGNINLKVRMALAKTPNKSKIRYLLGKMFIIPVRYRNMYPKIYKNIFTRPLLVVLHWFRDVTIYRENVVRELKSLKDAK